MYCSSGVFVNFLHCVLIFWLYLRRNVYTAQANQRLPATTSVTAPQLTAVDTGTGNTLLYSRVSDQREFNTVTSQDPTEHSLGNTNGRHLKLNNAI